MPFIEQGRRIVIGKHGLKGLAEIQPGDRCYVYYKKLVDEWRKEPRWSTVHRLFRDDALMISGDDKDDFTAAYLAWHVFFNIYVMPYEQQKRQENGDVI